MVSLTGHRNGSRAQLSVSEAGELHATPALTSPVELKEAEATSDSKGTLAASILVGGRLKVGYFKDESFLQLHFEPSDLAAVTTHSAELRLTATSKRHLHIIVNGFAGSKLAQRLLDNAVQPLLQWAGATSAVHVTESEGHAGRIAKEVVEQAAKHESAIDIAIMGGDGTVHEVLNGLLLSASATPQFQRAAVSVNLVLLPCGTANALYYHFFPPERPSTPSTSALAPLYSLLAFLQSSEATSLPLARNTLPSAPETVITSVVTSASLHAAILHDAEALRESTPSLERFKLAAQQNAEIRTHGVLVLAPGSLVYSKDTKAFSPLSEAQSSLEGPFSYLASALVSRFEASFIVAPHRNVESDLAPASEEPTMDVVVIRAPADVAPAAFVPKLWETLGGMYGGGVHVDSPVVSYYRCSSFTWSPEAGEDPKALLVCLDGAVHALPPDKALTTHALSSSATGIRVWV